MIDIPEIEGTLEEQIARLKVLLMTHYTDHAQVTQHQLAYEECLKDIARLNGLIKGLENEVAHLRKNKEKNRDAYEDFLELTQTLDFRVPCANVRFIVNEFEFMMLRFDRDGKLTKAFSPPEYQEAIKKEWSNV
jgi:hypothetical protein